ncbi:alpha-1,2-Mannosidase [Mycena chlorophos]|uniref:alpha-1,2-Mannosidase n=1 Tax=Mycena chlorophos TaxID=658473 RepID=A0A8H6W9N0_MYCCL|nr:alpha-1,2-Mannosidase [Mycena chlorophos]
MHWKAHPNRPPLGQILRHRPFLYAALTALILLAFFFWPREPQQTLTVHGNSDAFVLPESTSYGEWERRAELVKAAFVHAYSGYEKFAAPHDELRPLTDGFNNPFNGWGVTAVDSLDTMLLMKLDREYRRTLARISQWTFPMTESKVASYFETVIRYLGGLLSGYAISQDRVLLDRAEDLVQQLDSAFKPYGGTFPVVGVNTDSGRVEGPEMGFLAEIASLQVEYLYLAKATGKKQYYDRAMNIITALAAAPLDETGGMMPVKWNLTSLQPDNTHIRLSVGGQADSAHEYLLKQYLLSGRTDKKSLEMYIRTTTHIITHLLYLSPNRHLLYVSEIDYGKPTHRMDHLACFLPGLFALGAHLLPLDDLASLGVDPGLASPLAGYSLRDLHLWAAAGLAETCYALYADQPTGLAPDQILIKVSSARGIPWFAEVGKWREEPTWKGKRATPPGVGENLKSVIYTEHERQTGRGRGRDYAIRIAAYLLRPETIESLYVLYRVTGDSKWREMGWRIFQSIERETRTEAGYASLSFVEVSPGIKSDSMPSYFLAETLKYLYLLFVDEDPFPLDQWVFNTEAHPLPVFHWTEAERERFAIP